jgi:Ca2+-binding RTX toxin-like protein
MHTARLLTTVLATAAAAVAVDPAHAVPPANSTEVKIVGSVLYVTSSGVVDNDIHINGVNDEYSVADWAAPTFPNGGGCSATNPGQVRCPKAGVTRVVVDAGAGNDSLGGGPGIRNELHGGSGDDRLFGSSTYDTLDGGPGSDELWGGGGLDLADYRGRANGVLVTLDGLVNDGEPGERDIIKNDVEGVYGGSGNDTLSGSGTGDRLLGGPGDDSLWGAGGGDVLNGGPGIDNLNGGDGSDTFETDPAADGADTFNGGPGIWDVVTYWMRTAPVFADIDGIADDGASGEGDNISTDVENLTGGLAGDVLVGSPGPNQVSGGDGDDALTGRDGDDYVTGGAGNDTLWGADGVDNLNGGPGNDMHNGGAGADTLFARDFINGNDQLTGGSESDSCTADTGDARSSCER